MGAPDNVLPLHLPADQFSTIATKAMADALERGGVVEAIKEASLAALALRGYIDKEAAAKFLGVETRTLEAWMRPEAEGGKGLPHLKFDRAVRFRIEALEEWARKFEVNPLVKKFAA